MRKVPFWWLLPAGLWGCLCSAQHVAQGPGLFAAASAVAVGAIHARTCLGSVQDILVRSLLALPRRGLLCGTGGQLAKVFQQCDGALSAMELLRLHAHAAGRPLLGHMPLWSLAVAGPAHLKF